MISWKEYIKSNILEFRKRYEELPEESKRIIKEDILLFSWSLNKPCQVILIDFVEPYPKCVVILRSEEYPDMEVIVLKNVAFGTFSSEVLEKVELLKSLDIKEINAITGYIKQAASEIWGKTWCVAARAFKKSYLLLYSKDPRSVRDREIADFMSDIMMAHVNSALREKQRKKIEQTVGDIKRDAEAIPEAVDLRNKIIENTTRLDNQIKELNKKVEEDVSAIRKLVGTSKDFLDWKVFSTDVEHLKETHIAKDVFDAHMKRLDEKIDKGLDALNTRIDDLKAIKFWSKRTLLDIILAAIATVSTIIAALLAAGILKF
jgi:hypothetical protein